ncbi:MAG TPA: PspC domain-containing protein [Acidimicrobiales bacterium]|nr:PspC domain-containing protein [Acidimicrobiales bacterium]
MNTMNDTTPPAEQPPYQQPGNRLTRSTDDKVVGGLAGGLGRWFGIDPVVFRIAFVVLTLAGGSGILLYLIGWLMIPDDAGGAALNRFGSERNSKLVAAVLAGCGLLILLENIGGGDDDVPFGLVLVGLGGLYLWSRRKSADGGPPTPPSPPSPPAPTTPPAGTEPLFVSPPTDAIVDSPPPPPAPPKQGPPVEPKSRSAVVPVTLSLLAVLAGGLTLFGVSATTGLALALLVTAGGLVVGAWRGRARWLIPVGLVLSMALAAASLIDVPMRGGSGDISFHPVALEDIRSPYRLGAGSLTVDLRDIDLAGQTVTVVASIAAGQMQVVLPAGVAVEVDAHVGAGDLIILGRQSDGLDIRREVVEPGPEGAGRIVLRARAGIGEVEVRRAAA